MYKRIDHVALHVADLRRSIAFYERHFGFENYFQAPVPGGIDIAYLKLGDTVLELTHHSDGEMTGFHFCLETDDFDKSVSTLQAAGVAVGVSVTHFGLHVLPLWKSPEAEAEIAAAAACAMCRKRA